MGSDVKDRQIGRTVQPKIGAKEEYDETPDKITMPKKEYNPIKIASREKETTGEARERAKWQYYYGQLKTLLKTDPVFKILRPKVIGPLDKPISVPLHGTNKVDEINLILQMLDDMGICPDAFDGDELLSCSLEQLKDAANEFVEIMIMMVGKANTPEDKIGTPSGSLRKHPAGSPRYASDDSESESDGSISIRQMSLGPSGGRFLKEKIGQAKIDAYKGQAKSNMPQRSTSTRTGLEDQEEGDLSRYFNSAMKKYEADQRTAQQMNRQPNRYPDRRTLLQPSHESLDMPDVEMESVGSDIYQHIHEAAEYDPDDLWMPEPRRPHVAATGATTGGGSITQRIRISAISELKEYSGKDREEDKARNWIGKVKSAFIRDQAPDEERCLVFGDLMVGPARYWYRQLSRSTRFNWKELMNSFLVEYAGHGMSASRQYYHAKKRSEEDPLQCLYRLNVMGMQAKIPVMTGLPAARKEHVNHFIDTLDDPDLSNQLLLLNVEDAEAMQKTLHGYQQGRSRQGKVMMGSSKFRQKGTQGPALSKPARAVRMVRTEDVCSESGSDTCGSDLEDRLRSIHVAATAYRRSSPNDVAANARSVDPNTRQDYQDRNMPLKPCTHCGSTKHGDLGCWKRLTCQKCGRKGHPSDNCFFVCRACGEMHDPGKCPMEEFYNMIRQWYVPNKHAGMLPEKAEKMLN
uniref:CCHC-type domain-containing protein n=1 Tax=Peronospora matthiolae TaxID=2874970 RepID=A0AAV1VBW5_9STRA